MSLTNCYKLYSCDGSIDPFYSNEPNLSGFVNDYVVLNITSPEVLSGECFFVKFYTAGTCDSTTIFTIDYSGICDCKCNCYTFKTPNSIFLTEYINCNDNLISTYLPTGQTFNFCAKTKPYFDYEGNIVVKNGGLCINNACPKPPITIKPRNECDVLTIFPMDVFCNVIHPSGIDTFDGTALLTITGGTPPYTIAWENGSLAQLITGLSPGEYSAVVSDFYNDFVVTSTCILTGLTPTPTPTLTPTPTPLPTYDPICFRRTLRKGELFQTIQTQFYPSSYINGYPSWTASPENALMYWVTGSTPNYWTISGLTSIGAFKNNDPSIPPLSNWTIQGNPLILSNSIIAYSGICSSGTPITFHADTLAAKCGKDGKITISAEGGIPSYLYSIDGGTTYFSSSVFNNLPPGTYYVRVKDSLGNESGVQTVTITLTPAPTYGLTMTTTQVSGNDTFTITASPSLPPSETIQFDITLVSTLFYYPNPLSLFPPQPVPTYNNNVIFTSPTGLGLMTLVGTQNTTGTINPSGCGDGVTTYTQTKTYTKTLTISGGQTITGTITDLVTNPLPSSIKCTGTNGTYTIQISNGRTLICPCCPVTIINTPVSTGPKPGNGFGLTLGDISIKRNPPKL